MTQLSLSQNNFTGTIPTSITNLLSILVLELDNNQISGSIPVELFQLPFVYLIDVSDNQLSGTIPDLHLSLELSILDVSNNKLNGSIPNLLASQNLTSVNFGLNQLSGSIPDTITFMSTLSVFIARENSLNGSIPAGFTSMPNMTFWDVSYNGLVGTIPVDIDLMPQLTHFSMGYNGLHGTIPDTLCALRNMSFINLSANRLTSSIPACLGNLSHLALFYADFNAINGTIPPSMGYLTELTVFALSNNQLTGAVPTSLGNATKLEYLLLGHNQLNSDVPFEISRLANLVFLDLSYNHLFGPFPYGIGAIQKLRMLQIDHNNLSCPLGSLGNLVLESCDATNNVLCGGDSSTAIYNPTCGIYFPNSCKLTECTLAAKSTPATAFQFNGPDGSKIQFNPTLPSFTINTVDPRTKKTSVMKVEVLELNENLMNSFLDIASRKSSVLNRIDATTLTWTLSTATISTPRNPQIPLWTYQAYIPSVFTNVSIIVAYLPASDSIYVYNETLTLANGGVKVSVESDNWNLITRPSLDKVWATSCVFRVTTSGADGFFVSDPVPSSGSASGTPMVYPLKMTSSQMTGSIQAIEDGQYGDPGTLSPLVRLVYNSSADIIAAKSGGQSFLMSTYYVMPSTANVTFSYDLAFQLVRTPVPPPKPQLLGNNVGFAFLIIFIFLLLAFFIFATLMYKFPKLRRKALPCLGRASDPVEYI